MSVSRYLQSVPTLALIALLSFPVASTVATAQEQSPQPSVVAEQAADPLSEAELEILVARIALYPDALVALVTSASLFPLQVVEAERFLGEVTKNKTLEPKDSWDGSVISLLNYPDILKMMSDDLDWTQSLGSALAYQQKDVLIAIQTLREKAVANGVIKTDDKVKVEIQQDTVVIQAANPEKIYVPQYPPEMLYEPGYVATPITYYPDPYPSYYYPTAPYFAAAFTGAIWAATVDWDDWGVWGGRWGGNDIDIDCNRCFNDIDINGKVNINDVDWKKVDRSKISFDHNQFAKIDSKTLNNDFKQVRGNNVGNRAKDIRQGRDVSIGDNTNRVSVDDIRKSKVSNQRVSKGSTTNIDRAKASQAAQAKKPASKASVDKAKNVNRKVNKPKPGGRIDNRAHGGKPSALGKVGKGKQTQISSNRGHKSMGGGHRGGGSHKVVQRGGGGRRH